MNFIDERWDKQIHILLHVAGYFLNTQMHYCLGFKSKLVMKQDLM